MIDHRYLKEQAIRLRHIAAQIRDPQAMAAIEAVVRELDERVAQLERRPPGPTLE